MYQLPQQPQQPYPGTPPPPPAPPGAFGPPAFQSGAPVPGQQPYSGPGPNFPQLPPKKRRRRWPWIAGAIVLVLIIIIGAANEANTTNSTTQNTSDTTPQASVQSQSSPSPQATNVPTPTPKPTPTFAHFADGTFTVGKDIQPGTYRTRAASPGCYFARLRGFGGTVDDIIANENTDFPAIVTISSGDKGFQSQNCGTWTKDLSAITSSKTSFGDGMFIIGTDITPGTYKSSGQQGCYYARLRSFGGTTDDIIANDNTDTAAIVTISAGDKGFQSQNCGTWTKQ